MLHSMPPDDAPTALDGYPWSCFCVHWFVIGLVLTTRTLVDDLRVLVQRNARLREDNQRVSDLALRVADLNAQLLADHRSTIDRSDKLARHNARLVEQQTRHIAMTEGIHASDQRYIARLEEVLDKIWPGWRKDNESLVRKPSA